MIIYLKKKTKEWMKILLKLLRHNFLGSKYIWFASPIISKTNLVKMRYCLYQYLYEVYFK